MFPIYLFLAFFVANSLNAQNNSIKEPKFEKVDAGAKDKIYFKEKDIEKLAKALNRCATRGISKEISKSNSFKKVLAINKARAITVWMAENLDYDDTYNKDKCDPNMSNYDEKNHDVENILKNRQVVCEGYAYFFVELSKKMGLNAKHVSGYAGKNQDTSHAWNIFEVPNEGWYHIDVTWFDNKDKPYCGKLKAKDVAARKYKLLNNDYNFTNKEKNVSANNGYLQQYFMPDPYIFIEDHFPKNPEYQLINPPIKKEDYLSSK